MRSASPGSRVRRSPIRVIVDATLIVALAVVAATFGQRTLMPNAAQAAPAQIQAGEITFSPAVTPLALPIEPMIQYPSGTQRIWASFDFDLFNGEHLDYMLQANGDDFQWGALDCCAGPAGRYAFPISRPSGRLLGGAAYKLTIYANERAIAVGGFGINGKGGFDANDNDQ